MSNLTHRSSCWIRQILSSARWTSNAPNHIHAHTLFFIELNFISPPNFISPKISAYNNSPHILQYVLVCSYVLGMAGLWTSWMCATTVDVLKFLDFRNGHRVSIKLNFYQGETWHIFSGLKKHLDTTDNEMSPACGLVRAVIVSKPRQTDSFDIRKTWTSKSSKTKNMWKFLACNRHELKNVYQNHVSATDRSVFSECDYSCLRVHLPRPMGSSCDDSESLYWKPWKLCASYVQLNVGFPRMRGRVTLANPGNSLQESLWNPFWEYRET